MADYNSAYTGQEIDEGIAKANAAVPGSRTVNGKALSADVTLSAADVGARASSWTPDAAEVGADPAGTAETKANAVQANLTSHTNNKSNPHSVTKAQVGLGNVDNTSDANKPISTATQTALNGKANTSHTHAAGDIASGTLPASRGGTGYTSLSSLMSAINNRATSVSSANTSYTTLMARGTKLVSSDTSPGVNGAISWTYG